MKILHVIRSVNPSNGGPVEVIKQVSAALQEMGHDASVVSLDFESDSWVGEFPLRIHALGQSGGTFGYSSRLIPWLRENAAEFDGIITHGLWQFHGLAVWWALRATKQPYFVFTHGMLDPWFKRAYPMKHLKKVLYWLAAERLVLKNAGSVLFTCEEERELARSTFAPYRCREEIVTLGTSSSASPPELLRTDFFEHHPELSGKRILLFLGRLHEKKGCDLLLEAFAQVPSGMHLVFAGPCEDESFLQKLKTMADGLNVTFIGLIKGDLKWGALAAAEAFILPSHQENFGMAVAESLAMGTPVLISNRVNIWREIQADGAGLVEPDTLEGTRNLLLRWHSLQRMQMRAAAAACFSRRFDIRTTAENIILLLQRSGQPSPRKGHQTMLPTNNRNGC
jgi:glycosyltransferase involved in cell wall biosynthesis